MIGVVVSVPVACWRVPHAREFLETYHVPPPSTCYGFLLALVGEEDPERHRGVRLTMACTPGPVSTVLRTLWRVKSASLAPGVGANARPDYQELVTEREVAILFDSAVEAHEGPNLETRVTAALSAPSSIERYGGLSMGESSHLVNDIRRNDQPGGFEFFEVDPEGTATFPVWVDHVGASATTYVTGSWRSSVPPVERFVSIYAP